jgi:ribosomal protein S18 acetylase RimI-like enzyme
LSVRGCEYELVNAFIRPATVSDRFFHQEMTRQAFYSDPNEPMPSLEEAMQDPGFRQYFEGWGREGDIALVATDPRTGQTLGMAWSRKYPAEKPSYGFVGPDVPEVSIAVTEDARGADVGTKLMERLLEANRQAGFKDVSLGVEGNNPAVRLYERLGFKQVRAEGDVRVMKLALGLSARAVT